MTRKWLLTASIMLIGTATLFGCGKKDTPPTSSDTQEITTEAATESTESTEVTTEATTESESTTETTTDDSTESSTEETPSTEPLPEVSTSDSNSSNDDVDSPSEEEDPVPKVDKTTSGSGVFNGQIDSTSIEVQMDDGSYETFFIYNEDVAKQFDNMDIGAKISFTYGPVKGQVNPEILSVSEKN